MTMLPTLERELREAAARQQLRRRGRPTRRVGVIAVACAVALSGTAFATVNALLPIGNEAPDQAPAGTAPVGNVAPGTDTLLRVQAPDPDGGPAWGLRVYRTTNGLTCLQPGRVQGGVMGVVGDDSRFHPQAPQVHDCQQAADAVGLSGRAVLLASGQIPIDSCRVADEHSSLPSCDPSKIRTLIYGIRASQDEQGPQPYILVTRGLSRP
jgi:hypothetical protein